MTGREIVVHFGVHKTGTSSIQRTLSNARESLAAEGVLYPTILDKENHFDLYTYFHERPLEYRMVKARGITRADEVEKLKDEIRRSFEAQLSASREERVVLSSEAFSLMNPREMQQFVSYLTSLGFENVKAIVYLRDYVTYWESNLQQAIKAGNYIDFASEEGELTHVRTYKSFLEALCACVKGSNIEIRLFHRPLLKDGDAVADFFERIDIRSVPPSGSHLNESLSKTAMFALNELNKRVPRHAASVGTLRQNVAAILKQSGGGRYHAGSAVVQRILDRTSDDRAYLAQHWFGGRDRFAEIIEEVAADPARCRAESAVRPSPDEIMDAIALLYANLQRQAAEQGAARWRAVARIAQLEGNEKRAQNAMRTYHVMKRRLEDAHEGSCDEL